MCQDVTTDPANCGGCGNQCPGSNQRCGGNCTDTTSDPNNCGTCSNACPPNQNCCGSGCSDPTSDPANCGSCGTAAPRSRAANRRAAWWWIARRRARWARPASPMEARARGFCWRAGLRRHQPGPRQLRRLRRRLPQHDSLPGRQLHAPERLGEPLPPARVCGLQRWANVRRRCGTVRGHLVLGVERRDRVRRAQRRAGAVLHPGVHRPLERPQQLRGVRDCLRRRQHLLGRDVSAGVARELRRRAGDVVRAGRWRSGRVLRRGLHRHRFATPPTAEAAAWCARRRNPAWAEPVAWPIAPRPRCRVFSAISPMVGRGVLRRRLCEASPSTIRAAAAAARPAPSAPPVSSAPAPLPTVEPTSVLSQTGWTAPPVKSASPLPTGAWRSRAEGTSAPIPGRAQSRMEEAPTRAGAWDAGPGPDAGEASEGRGCRGR